MTDATEIRIGIIGMGVMGKGLLHQSTITPGLRCTAVCDLNTAKAATALAALDIPHEAAANEADASSIVAAGKVAVLACGEDLSRSGLLDVVIEASSAVSTAIDHCLVALAARKHLVLMNAEIDLTYGPLLARAARENGVVSTSCGGDQYGVLKDLLDDIEAWGFDLVMAGNIKGFLDRYATPTTIVPEADKRNLDYRMCTSYTDGSKLNIEMAIVANAYDMRPIGAGMTGPRLDHATGVFEAFDFSSLWTSGRPLVDYILGAEPGGGVFAIGHCGHPYQRDMLKYYKMGDGPFYLFYRPYHLCHIEAMAAVKHAVREGREDEEDELKEIARDRGLEILRAASLGIGVGNEKQRQDLWDIGMAARELETRDVFFDGGDSLRKLIDGLGDVNKRLQTWLANLSPA